MLRRIPVEKWKELLPHVKTSVRKGICRGGLRRLWKLAEPRGKKGAAKKREAYIVDDGKTAKIYRIMGPLQALRPSYP
ncbi:MAG: hypothetical protein V1676_05650 [Candidatus Diapherotrites archaeon]